MKKLIHNIQSSLSTKITIITAVCLLAFLTAIISVTLGGLNDLQSSTLTVVEDELEILTSEYYENYLNAISIHIEENINDMFEEIHILSNIVQTFFTNREYLDEVVESIKSSEYFSDNLEYSGSWYQNSPEEPTSLLVVGYLVDENDKINEDAVKIIEDTQILDLILPSFMTYGVDKIQVYYQGGENKEIVRIAPWTDLGNDLVDVYPEIFNAPIWETFNPGLAKEWRDKIKDSNGDIEVMNSLLRVTPPVQDGVSGDVVLTISQPIANSDFTEFEGTISYDVPIDNMIKIVENVQISETGFAFLTQSDGNVFGINEQGLQTLGLLSDEDSMIDSVKGFNTLKRFFSDSSYETVKDLKLNNTSEPRIEMIVIDGHEYLLASKGIAGYQSWSSEKSFFNENWQIGFIVPKEEIYKMYPVIKEGMFVDIKKINSRMIAVVIIIALILLFFIYKFNEHITRELTALASAVYKVKDNNYDFEVYTKSKDEVGVLTIAFQKMVNEIKSSFVKLENQNIVLKKEIEVRKQKDRIIDYLENFDSGTDLPNKKALLNILKDVNKDETEFVSLVVVGLDEFGKVNEAYSWTFGDKLMREIADRLNSIILDNGLLFKLSGDEFAYVLKESKLRNLISIVEDTNEAFKKPFIIENHEVTISSSIGISSYPYDSDDPLDIFKYALNAMSHAKEVNKGNYEFYNAEINTTARDRMEMISELRNAVEHDELVLFYQPIISSISRKTTGMEALLRWSNPNIGSVPPHVFIPLAEKTKVILPIGNWVINRALHDAKSLHDKGYDHLNIAINVSVIQFLESDLVQTLKKSIEASQINPARITVEITEGLFINDLSKILSVMNEIRKLGILISVDDFGTGFSSLSYIKNLPLSKLKIDRSFINEMGEGKGKKLTDAIIGLANNLDLSIVAEGVETEEQMMYLKNKECEEIQGFLFSKPLDYDDFILYLENE